MGPGIATRIFAGDHAMLSVVTIEPGAVGTLHHHPEEQWGVLLEGSDTEVFWRPTYDPAGFILLPRTRGDATEGLWAVPFSASRLEATGVAEGRVDSEKADPLNLLLSQPSHTIGDAVSRVRDLVISSTVMILFAPLFFALAIAIKLDSKGSVFYKQTRAGKRGRPIDVLKFRTMVQNAESISGAVWAQEDDPRITRLGKFLRRFRLDELPQFWNVLIGEMSLVGPRPERPEFFAELRAEVPIFELRNAMRPGITGWAQVRAPYAADAEDARQKLDYDLFYLCNRSFWFDLAILFETIGVAFGGKGAR